MNDYPPSGVLFQNDRKKSEKSPDYTGQIELSDEVVNDLVEQMSRGVTKPKVSLIGWKKVSQKTGKPFLSLLGNTYEERPNGAAQQQPQKLDDNIPF
jgi:hypothetical protein